MIIIPSLPTEKQSPTFFALAFSEHAKTNICTPTRLSLQGLIQTLAPVDPPIVSGIWQPDLASEYEAKKNLPAWSPARMPGGIRGGDYVLDVSILVLDLDRGASQEQILALTKGLCAIQATTWSHTIAHSKWRVSFPLLTPVPVADWAITWAAMRRFAASFDIEVDESTKNPANLYFLPAVPAESKERQAAYTAGCQNGEYLDPEALRERWRPRIIIDPTVRSDSAKYVANQSRWARGRAYAEARASGVALPTPVSEAVRHRHYAAAMVANQCEEIPKMLPGMRSTRLWVACRDATRLSLAGVLDLEPAIALFRAAAAMAGLDVAAISYQTTRGIAEGQKEGAWDKWTY